MISIPKELREQFERGNMLLFIGERIVRDADGYVVFDRLAAQLAARCGFGNDEVYTFPEIAQIYEDKVGRHGLVQFLYDQMEVLDGEPRQIHYKMAKLTLCNVLVTTCFDQRMERAFEKVERPLHVIIDNVDIAFDDERKTQLYKLRGSLQRVESLVLTRDQYEAFEDQAGTSMVFQVLQGYLARRTILFLGYDLADPYFQRLYSKVIAPLDSYARRAYALFAETPSLLVSSWCKRKHIDIIEAKPLDFLEVLSQGQATPTRLSFDTRLPPAEEPILPLPERPYKFLDYYESKDSAIFFGRQEETQQLTALIHAHRLVLLYGDSGVGKTSLLLAGIVPRLERARPPYETIYVRALEDPALDIRRTLRRRMPSVELPEGGSLVDFLDVATKALGYTLVIIIDQFEEFFVRLAPKFQELFIKELGALYDARDVPVKVVISIRRDWLESVEEVEKRIPEALRIKMRLLPLSRDRAHQAITAPVQRLGISYEAVLVEQLLDDLASHGGTAVSLRDAIAPPQLQLVCSTLYEGLGRNERTITLATYGRMGGAHGVFRKYLDDELALLGHDQETLARSVLGELTTSHGTKAVKTSAELALALNVERSDVELVLDKLERARLLRALERGDGEAAYELAHEYLILETSFGVETQARKAAEELLAQQLDSWRHYGTAMSPDHLRFVAPSIGKLVLSIEAWNLLLRSALMYNCDVSFWVASHPNPRQAADEMLFFLMEIDLEKDRRAHILDVANELGWGENEWAEWYPPLVTGLKDHSTSANKSLRVRAREVLACIGFPSGLSLGQCLSIYASGVHILIPKHISQILLFGFGGFLGGLLSGVLLIPLGWLAVPGFVDPNGNEVSEQVLVRLMLILGPGLGIIGSLIGHGKGIGTVLGRGRSLLIEVVNAAVGGAVGGALVVSYLYLFRVFTTDISPSVAVPGFAGLCALAAGLIVCCMLMVKRLVKWSQTLGQVMAGATIGIAMGSVGDIVFGTFPAVFVTGMLFGTGVATGLRWGERWSEAGKR